MALVKKSAVNLIGSAITKQFNGFNIRVREIDGYIHATDMCKVGKKRWNDYITNKTTKAFLTALETDTRILVTKLIESNQGGDAKLQGTWVHPHIAINLAQWVSPMFAVKVAGWVSKFISGDLSLIQDSVEMMNESSGKVNNLSNDY
jgi:hypothetical protein